MSDTVSPTITAVFPPLDERKLPNKFVCKCLQYKFWNIFYCYTVIIQQIMTCVYVAWHSVVGKVRGRAMRERVAGGSRYFIVNMDALCDLLSFCVYMCVFSLPSCGVCVFMCVCVCVCVCVCEIRHPYSTHFVLYKSSLFFIRPLTHIKQCPNIKHVQLPETKTLMTAWGTTGRHLTVYYSKQPGPQCLSSQVEVGFCGDVETVFQK